MKTLRLIIAAIALMLFGALQTTHAQISVTIGTPPPWGPAEAPGIRFYYLPDIEVYFDVNTGEYIYLSDGAWIRARNLPRAYADYDLYGAYKVPLREYHGERPWDNHRDYHKNYPRGYNKGHYQKTNGERPDKDHKDHH
jgi:hypothetical protein